MNKLMVLAALLVIGGCDDGPPGNNPDGGPTGKTIAITGKTIDPEKALLARVGVVKAVFGEGQDGQPCYTTPCDNNQAFMVSWIPGVKVSLYGYPNISTVSDNTGSFSLQVPESSTVRLVLEKPEDPVYIPTIDGVPVHTGTVDLKNLPFHICRKDKMYKALLDKDAHALDAGGILTIINNNTPLPQNGPRTDNIDFKVSSGKFVYVGYDSSLKQLVVDTDYSMPSYKYAIWVGAVTAYASTDPSVKVTVTDTTPVPDPGTGRPYTYPVVTVPVQPQSSTLLLLYPFGTF